MLSTHEEVCAALLHDVVEDTGESFSGLRLEGVPEVVIGAVDALTRREGETYETYVSRVSGNPIARRVKEADLICNMDLSRLGRAPSATDLERLDKYRRALRLLIFGVPMRA